MVGSIKVRDVEITVLKDDKNAVLIRELTKIVAVIFVVDAVDIWVEPHLSSAECRMTMTLQRDAVYTFFGQKVTFRCASLYKESIAKSRSMKMFWRFFSGFGSSVILIISASRGKEEIDAEQFVGVKGFKAKGKRLTTWKVSKIEELEPTRFPEETGEDDNNSDDEDTETQVETTETTAQDENLDPDAGKSQQQVIDEITGQLSLFPDE